MASIKMPTNDTSRIAFFHHAIQAATKDQAQNLFYLSAHTLAEIEAFITQFEASHQAVAVAKTQWRHQQKIQKKARQALQRMIRDFWSTARRQAKRDGALAQRLGYYGLNVNGRQPHLGNIGATIQWGKRVIEGEAQSVAAGFTAITNPGAAEIESAISAALAGQATLMDLARRYDSAQTQFSEQRVQAKQLIRKVLQELRAQLYGREPVSRRRVMRRYGAKFRYRRGETPDVAEVETPVEPADDDVSFAPVMKSNGHQEAATAEALSQTAVVVGNGHLG